MGHFQVASYYEPDPEVRSRIALFYSYEDELRYDRHDTASLTAEHMQHFTGFHIVPYAQAQIHTRRSHPRPLLHSGWDWTDQALAADQAHQDHTPPALRWAGDAVAHASATCTLNPNASEFAALIPLIWAITVAPLSLIRTRIATRLGTPISHARFRIRRLFCFCGDLPLALRPSHDVGAVTNLKCCWGHLIADPSWRHALSDDFGFSKSAKDCADGRPLVLLRLIGADPGIDLAARGLCSSSSSSLRLYSTACFWLAAVLWIADSERRYFCGVGLAAIWAVSAVVLALCLGQPQRFIDPKDADSRAFLRRAGAA